MLVKIPYPVALGTLPNDLPFGSNSFVPPSEGDKGEDHARKVNPGSNFKISCTQNEVQILED